MSDVMDTAQQKLVEDNLNLVHHIIWKHYPTFNSDEDIYSCATLGLCKAAMTWDESKSKFTTYACACIRNAIRRELKSRAHQVDTISLELNTGDDITLADMLADESELEKVIDYTFVEKLTEDEKLIFDLRQQGLEVEEIENLTGYNHRKVLRIMRNARLKYHKYN